MMLLSVTASALLLCIPIADVAHNSPSPTPLYMNTAASVDDRVAALLSRMNIQDKTSELIQGDTFNWINITTDVFNETGLA
jgi:beta-glucosidase